MCRHDMYMCGCQTYVIAMLAFSVDFESTFKVCQTFSQTYVIAIVAAERADTE